MKAVRTIAPEFDPVRDDLVAAPMRGSRHVLAVEPALHFLEPSFENSPAFKRPRLVRGPCTKLRIALPACEIGISLVIRYGPDHAFDPHLPAKRLPVEQQ